jgi:heme A synthase
VRVYTHAVVTAVATLALMVMGTVVFATGSSLACPDWPLCRGSFFPAMTGGIALEHTHRLMAAGVITLLVTLFFRVRRRDAGTRRLVGAACALVALQAILGGLTVLYRLPPAISVTHLATSMTLLAVLVVLAVRLSPLRRSEPGGLPRRWTGATALLVFAQIVLGGVVRHTGATLACAGVPLCNGALWPGFWTGEVQMLHRSVGVLAAVAALMVSLAAYGRERTGARRAIALAPAVVAGAQVGLGVAVVLARAPVHLIVLHHAGGAALLASLALNWATGAQSLDR